MVTIVIAINCSIALICLGLTWFLLKLKARLGKIAKSLEAVEQKTHKILAPAPKAILKGQKGTRRSRARYQNIKPNLQRAYQILSLLNVLTVSQVKPTIWGLVRRNTTRRL